MTNPVAAFVSLRLWRLHSELLYGLVLRPEAQGSLPCAQTGRRHGTTKGGRNRVRRRPVGSVLCGVLACQRRVPRSGAVGRIEGYGSPAPGTRGRLCCAASYGCCKPWEGQGLRTRLINGNPEGPVDGAGSATCTAPRSESKGIRVCDKAETPARGDGETPGAGICPQRLEREGASMSQRSAIGCSEASAERLCRHFRLRVVGQYPTRSHKP